MDFLIRTVIAIEREVNDAKSIRDTGANDKRKVNQSSSSSSRKK